MTSQLPLSNKEINKNQPNAIDNKFDLLLSVLRRAKIKAIRIHTNFAYVYGCEHPSFIV